MALWGVCPALEATWALIPVFRQPIQPPRYEGQCEYPVEGLYPQNRGYGRQRQVTCPEGAGGGSPRGNRYQAPMRTEEAPETKAIITQSAISAVVTVITEEGIPTSLQRVQRASFGS
ncbi:hypothetical protein DPMN_095681 [Dreissena polymorpha]|uniref:Uncharacterized protein n=1 Tax=Dreissena polymorpha TaxID=45954 RepID=A0A9D4L8F0_DREPO|nr:hypothetical protein DPMN_095681 [Dreissena polymorpha]